MSNRPLYSILHPTARLPDGWVASFRAWKEAASDWDKIEYVLCIDADQNDPTTPPDWYDILLVRNHGRKCSVDAYNAAAAASTGLILVNNMDDLFPPDRWDELLLEAISYGDNGYIEALATFPRRSLPDSERVLHCSSGSPRDDNLFIPQIMTRARYERLGYFYHPSYTTAYADDEFTQHAQQDGVVIEARHIRFRHLHPQLSDPDRWPWDDVYSAENRAEDYEHGRKNFEQRKAAGWPK